MSWFGKSFGPDEVCASVEEVDESFPETEIADGVVLERRRVLRVSVASAAALLVAGRASFAQDAGKGLGQQG